MMSDTPILYSYKNCPYCFRARISLKYAGLKIIVREVDINDLPNEILAVSSHASVPLLVINENEFFDESWDIVKWALSQRDKDNWLGKEDEYLIDAEMLVETNDYSFKEDLDHYRDSENFPNHSKEYYRQRGSQFLEELNDMLDENKFLLASHITVADIVVLPFIIAFSMVDKRWFDQSPYVKLQIWLEEMLVTDSVKLNIQQHSIWYSGDKDIYL